MTLHQPAVGKAPLETRVSSGCLGLILYYVVVLAVSYLAGWFGAQAANLTNVFLLAAVLYVLLVSLPMTVIFGQSPGQFAVGLEVASSGTSMWPLRRPGLLRSIVHIGLLLILFPIDWIPLAFGSSRTLHEIAAGTVVLNVDRSYSSIKQRLALGCVLAPVILLALAFNVWALVIGAYLGLAIVWGTLAALILVPGAAFLATVEVNSWRNRLLPERLNSLPPEARLAYLLHFTPQDLVLNRRGRLALMQRMQLLAGDLAWWLMAVLLIGGPVMLFVAMREGSVPLDFLKSGKLVLIALFAVGAGVWALYRAIDSGVDAVRGRVRSEETRLFRDSNKGNFPWPPTYYRLLTDRGRELKLWRGVFEAVNSNHVYRVYFVPLSKQLMSLEDAGVAHKQSAGPPSS